ncbi:hypothetical protein [Microbacterium arabinogalactanolyticum]|uniref:Uncharacterized protein n=1 Tax=Microbacterium arabinogalactanolyticum TaxID=69365 RepID=A0ABQ5NDF9_9MICO|nr:hypothetical protein [Microbacterium arabinogalactanolyticum]GLC83825.1 hypothetical protein MIAR_04130 [Microbacterium arabinogalactanolyticum]
MASPVDAILAWSIILLLITLPVLLGGVVLVVVYASKPLEQKYLVSGGGVPGGYASGLEAVFAPTAHEAGVELDRMTKRTAPAPVAGDPPWAIDGDRIRIDV